VRVLLKKLGAALHQYPVGARLVQSAVSPDTARLSFSLRKDKLRAQRKREGRYLLRSNITSGRSAEELWQFYVQLTEVEAAFKNLKDDLALRPIYHQLEHRIEAHIFISFLAYCPASRDDVAPTLARSGAGIDPTLGVGEVCHRANARRASAHKRRAHGDLESLHPTGERCAVAAGTPETGITRTTSTEIASWMLAKVQPLSHEELMTRLRG
jgi:hypothetical protein